jgi:hypothetical protein
MTIKKECVVKSLKSDYSIIGKALIAIVIIIGILYGFVISSNYIISLLSVIPAIMIFIISELVIMLLGSLCFTFIMEIFSNDIKDKSVTPIIILLNSLLMIFGITLYSTDVLIVFVGLLLVNALIVCPLLVAYVRCKE